LDLAESILTSGDGITWTKENPGIVTWQSSIIFGDSQYVVLGDGRTILTSPDGIVWTNKNNITASRLTSISYANHMYVVIGEGGRILTSPAVEVAIEKKQIAQHVITCLLAQYLSPKTLTLTLPNNLRSSAAKISIYSISGKRLYSRAVSTEAGEVRARIPALPVGVYAAGVEAKGIRQFAKFAVIK
jgi:hypothetical protein